MKIDLKTIITLVMTLGLVVFTFMGIIGPELFIATCGSVFAYYFNKDYKSEVKADATNTEKTDIDQ